MLPQLTVQTMGPFQLHLKRPNNSLLFQESKTAASLPPNPEVAEFISQGSVMPSVPLPLLLECVKGWQQLCLLQKKV